MIKITTYIIKIILLYKIVTFEEKDRKKRKKKNNLKDGKNLI